MTVATLDRQAEPAPQTADRPYVEFVGLQKSYDGTSLVVRDLNLSVRRGEFLTLLGPSGSGKTTTLMMLAGFEAPTEGRIFLDGASIEDLPPHKRDIGMVFQNYALFPHMTVRQNIAFPLSVRRRPRAEIANRVARALQTVRLSGLEDRRPGQLSGGQQQRVALARALVFEPKLVLMDEPLGALDKQLREQLQIEIKHLHERLGVTMVYVTHDQGEAMTMSDRIAVFNDGRIQQLDTAAGLYERPATSFVAQFIGENNRLPGAVVGRDGPRVTVRLDDGPEVSGLGGVPGRTESRPCSRSGPSARSSTRPRTSARQPLRRAGGGDDLSRRPSPRAAVAGRARRLHRQGARRRHAHGDSGARRCGDGRLALERLPRAGRVRRLYDNA